MLIVLEMKSDPEKIQQFSIELSECLKSSEINFQFKM